MRCPRAGPHGVLGMARTLGEVAKLIGGRLVGDGSVVITGVGGIREATPGELTFLSNPKYLKFLSTTSASAIIVSEQFRSGNAADGRPLVVADDPYLAFVRAVELFADTGSCVKKGVHGSAVVADSASLGEDVAIGASAVVMDRARIGAGSTIYPGSYIGVGATIGSQVVIYPNVTINAGTVIGDRVMIHSGTVVGSDGFGFMADGDVHRKIPQIGNVVIDDDVEIGAGVCVDRATVGTTRICRGTKIDNLVHIGHNVVIGEGSIVVAQVGISGSTEVGQHVMLGGQAGIAGHIEIGDGAMVGAQSGVTRSIASGERVSGYPAQKHTLSKRLLACLQRLPALFQRVRELEKALEKLKERE